MPLKKSVEGEQQNAVRFQPTTDNSSNLLAEIARYRKYEWPQQLRARDQLHFFLLYFSGKKNSEYAISDNARDKLVDILKALDPDKSVRPSEVPEEEIPVRVTVLHTIARKMWANLHTRDRLSVTHWEPLNDKEKITAIKADLVGLFNSGELLETAVDAAMESLWVLYEHDPRAFLMVLQWCITTKNTTVLEASLRSSEDNKTRETVGLIFSYLEILNRQTEQLKGAGYESFTTNPGLIIELMHTILDQGTVSSAKSS